MDAIERVEVSVRTRMVNTFSLACGPFGYLESEDLKGIPAEDHQEHESSWRYLLRAFRMRALAKC
jgi:abortive infection bacteriophage resistance protein